MLVHPLILFCFADTPIIASASEHGASPCARALVKSEDDCQLFPGAFL